MIDNLKQAYLDSLHMLGDGIDKVPDEQWRRGGEYLVPARLAYHILMGLEWLITTAPPRDHLRTRRYRLDNAAVEALPNRQALLAELAWMTGRIDDWFAAWARDDAAGQDTAFRLQKALYFLRHTQHHIGEFSAAVRLLQLPRPTWQFPQVKDVSVILDADGPQRV